MANLLDTIRQNSTSLATQQQGVTDQSQNLQQLMRAKSGKAVSGSDVAASNLGEQQAVAQTNQTMQNQIAPQAAIQNADLTQKAAGQQQQENIQAGQIAQQRSFDTVQNRIQTNQVLSDLERNRGQIDMDRDKAKLEQLGFQLRLQDQSYLDNLQREGSRSRLNDDLQFKQQLAASTLGGNQQLLERTLGNKSVLDASSRDFSKSMAQMDINTAYNMFTNDMKSAKDRAVWTAIGGLAGAGVAAGGTIADSNSKKEYYTNGAGQNSTTFEAAKSRGEV